MKKKKSLVLLLAALSFYFGLPTGAYSQQTSPAIENAFALKTSADRLLRNSRIVAAIEDYRKAIRLDSTNTALYFNLAIAYYSNNDMKNSAVALEKLIELDSHDAEALYNLGCVKLYLGDLEEAGSYFDKAKLCCPANSPFSSLIEEGIGFTNIVKELSPAKQTLLSPLLRQGVPPL